MRKRLFALGMIVLLACFMIAGSGPKKKIKNSIGMKFCLIPAGSFMMGASTEDGEAWDDEKPPHRVVITKPFYMGAHEVTQGQWEAIMGTTVREQADLARVNWGVTGEGTKYPIYYVSFREARKFCKYLSRLEGVTCRLPTEAEWEYAYRAGTTTRFFWGDSLDHSEITLYCWYERNADKDSWFWSHAKKEGAQRVGRKLPNAWGLYDMAGNVYELCWDWYDIGYYGVSPEVDPQGPEHTGYRVIRGGFWSSPPSFLRASKRNYVRPGGRLSLVGFRVVREVK